MKTYDVTVTLTNNYSDILLDISRIKVNQTVKFGQLKEYNKTNICLQKSCRKWDRGTSSRPIFVFLKNFTVDRSKWSAAWFLYFNNPQISIQQKEQFKTLDYWFRDMLNFNFLDKSLEIVSP